jgi:molybdopterin/thiamine biosynthesis adenylyltransferase
LTAKIISEKIAATETANGTYTPLFFRLSDPEQATQLERLLESKPHIQVYDTIWSQLREVVKTDHPSKTMTNGEIDEKIEERLAGRSAGDYGVWVYYPWNEKLVHILDEQEFVYVRTNRNKYKITDQEEAQLASRRVGVIGLSVGQSVSLTMAMERTFGELRIADYDTLEITNLNRLRSGVFNMGLLKTVLVAREIAEIDPFLKVTCYHEGINDNNIDDFLTKGGKLDVLIDECDSVDVKIKCRVAARKFEIPVLMEASDRCTVDIERFDLEPDRPILHGYVDHLDLGQMRDLKTMEEKLPYILPIVGIDTMSPRLKASAVEIGQTINTWPQLASAVTMGGGIMADICRKVLLRQLSVSGRYFIDIDELITDGKTKEVVFPAEPDPITPAEIKTLAAKLPATVPISTVIDAATTRKLMDAAVLAPSAGNNQPWKWYNDGKRLLLFDDPARSFAFANYDNMITHLSMGSAIENVDIAASAAAMALDVDLFPLKASGNLNPVAAVAVRADAGRVADPLFAYLKSRHTNRKPGDGTVIDAAILDEVRAEAMKVGVASVKFLTKKEDIARVADIAGKSDKLRMFIPEGHMDLFSKEMRWGNDPAKIKDGLDIKTLDLKPKDQVGFRVIRDGRAMQLLSDWDAGAVLENMTKDLMTTASAVCLISGSNFSPESCVNAGRAMQRAWLVTEKHGLAVQPVMAPIFHFARMVHGNGGGMSDQIVAKFAEMHHSFIELFNLSLTAEEPLFMFRIFRSEEPAVKSIRLDVEDVYYSN